MSKNFIFGLVGVIAGCISIGYAIATRQKENECDLSDETEISDVFNTIVKEVKRCMTKKTDATIEVLHFCKDILDSRRYRVAVGVVVVGLGLGLGGGLIISGYMPLPE